jgi:hypothetical protein
VAVEKESTPFVTLIWSWWRRAGGAPWRITWDVLVSSLHFGRRGCLADGWAALHREDPGTKQEHQNEPCHPEATRGRELREWTEQCRKPFGKVGTRFQFRLRIGDQSAAEGDGGEHGNRGDDGDAVAREAILEVAAKHGRGDRGGGEDRSDW